MRDVLTRKNVYVEGLPAEAEFKDFIDFFLKEHLGRKILDIGCGTGSYGLALQKLGFDYRGIDARRDYVAQALQRGLKVEVMDAAKLDYADHSFDTVILFEVLEHTCDFVSVLREAVRVARERVLLTVPNNSELDGLRQAGLTYWHIHTSDHVNFFTAASLSRILESLGLDFRLSLSEPIHVHRLLPAMARKPIGLLTRLKILRPRFFYRICGVITKPGSG